MKTTANIGFIAFFFLLCGVAAVQEREEPNFADAPKHRRGCDCVRLGDCLCGDPCFCWSEPEPNPLPPDDEDDPLPVPVDPPPTDDVGPIDDDGKKVISPLCYCNRDGKKCECVKCECGLAPLKQARREIIMHSRDNCPPCDSWWANERPKFEADGWVVALHVLRPDENGRTPFFTIDANGKSIEHQGWLSVEKAKELGK